MSQTSLSFLQYTLLYPMTKDAVTKLFYIIHGHNPEEKSVGYVTSVQWINIDEWGRGAVNYMPTNIHANWKCSQLHHSHLCSSLQTCSSVRLFSIWYLVVWFHSFDLEGYWPTSLFFFYLQDLTVNSDGSSLLDIIDQNIPGYHRVTHTDPFQDPTEEEP